LVPSFRRSPYAFVVLTHSLPAKSTSDSLPLRVPKEPEEEEEEEEEAQEAPSPPDNAVALALEDEEEVVVGSTRSLVST
jgi:hypothetical protein